MMICLGDSNLIKEMPWAKEGLMLTNKLKPKIEIEGTLLWAFALGWPSYGTWPLVGPPMALGPWLALLGSLIRVLPPKKLFDSSNI